MTIIACYQTNNTHWIASDSIAAADDFLTDLGPKVFGKNEYVVGFAISPRIGDIIKELDTLPKDIKDMNDFRDFRDAVMLAVIEEGGCDILAQPGETMEHPLEILIISAHGMWYMGPDYQITKIAEGYYAIGSGEQVAAGALFAANINKEEDGQKAVKIACSAAIKHIGTCGGEVCIMDIERAKKKRSRKK